ncbi:MAG TPA: hypothetical protein VHP13_07850 [Gammaproteobacteria bacterium]|jgi:hypothetical protein|nr:hypothetical protein [Gammaproteobacteria bacterium]
MKPSLPYPALLLAGGVLLSSVLCVQRSDWLVLAAPASLALCVLVGAALDSRLRGGWVRPSPAALILAASFLLAGLMVAQDREQLRQLMPILGASAAVVITRHPRRKACLPLP